MSTLAGSTLCLLLDDERLAQAITSEKHSYMAMHYHCRTVEKEETFLVLGRRSGENEGFAVVGRAEFVGNRRMSHEKILQEAKTSSGAGLPKTNSELEKLKDSFPQSGVRKTLPIWELKGLETFPTAMFLPENVVSVGSDAGLQEKSVETETAE